MSEYGYIPEAPEQSFGNNKGIFTPKDIYDLTRADKYTNYGQLELIETQTVTSGVSSVDFLNLKEDIYNVHFLTYNNLKTSVDGQLGLRFYESGVPKASTYRYAFIYGTAGGTFNEARSQGLAELLITASNGGTGSDRERNNGYCYFYDLGDSTKYSLATFHNFIVNATTTGTTNFGSGLLTQVSLVDGIKIKLRGGQNIDEGDFSLYGIRYS